MSLGAKKGIFYIARSEGCLGGENFYAVYMKQGMCSFRGVPPRSPFKEELSTLVAGELSPDSLQCQSSQGLPQLQRTSQGHILPAGGSCPVPDQGKGIKVPIGPA